jgi:hypothetical protein
LVHSNSIHRRSPICLTVLLSGVIPGGERLLETRSGRNVTVMHLFAGLEHGIVKSLLNLDLEVFILERRLLVSVDTNSSEHASVVRHIVAVLGLGSCETRHQAVKAQLASVFLIVFDEFCEVNGFESLALTVEVIGLLESFLIV